MLTFYNMHLSTFDYVWFTQVYEILFETTQFISIPVNHYCIGEHFSIAVTLDKESHELQNYEKKGFVSSF